VAWSICARNNPAGGATGPFAARIKFDILSIGRGGAQVMINPLKLQEMLSQASKMQEDVQQKLSQTIVEGSSGGGAITATMNGKKQLLKIRIDPSAVASLSGDHPDVEMLEDLVVAAVNDAGRKAEEAMQSSVQGMLGGLKIPGLS
jgi:DNA-binding YbaB/EbfC family protein